MPNPYDILSNESSFTTALIQHLSNAGFGEENLEELKRPSVRTRYYRKFKIPKKSGGSRDITAPTGVLKSVQSFIAELLSATAAPCPYVNGFAQGKSVVTNAKMHLDRNYILNIDLKDFFQSITAGMVRKALVLDGIDRSVAQKIADFCTWTDNGVNDLPEQVLPQGAPTSPVLSNIVCRQLDHKLFGLSNRFGLTYSRYADDITFSSYHSVYSKESEFWKELKKIISGNGFTLNEDKTRLQKKGCRMEVTGITVGKKLNVPRKWLKNLRAAIFQMEMFGCDEQEMMRIRGKLAYLEMVCGSNKACRKLYNRYRSAKDNIPFIDFDCCNYVEKNF